MRPPPPRGRGAAENPTNRFTQRSVEMDLDELDSELEAAGSDAADTRVKTTFLVDSSRSVIARNTSPDVPFDASVNPYRGCEHGCAYCYARQTHEWLGFSAGLDFETKILVKEDAPALLREALRAPDWQPQVLALSGVTDAYQPIEKKLGITRGVVEVLAEARHPLGIVTKNALVCRDIDLLTELAHVDAVSVFVSVTTLDSTLSGSLEPRASSPRRRLEAIRTLADAGIPVGVLVAPVIPGLNDHEIPAILEAVAEAGAQFAGWVLLRLPGAVEPVFRDWLEREVPDRQKRVENRLRDLRQGNLSDARFGHRMRGAGTWADHLRTLFEHSRTRFGLAPRGLELSTAAFRPPRAVTGQLGLF